MRRRLIFFAGLLAGCWNAAQAQHVERAGLYEVVERTFTSAKGWQNGFLQVDVDVTFTCRDDPSVKLTLPAFWNGKDPAGRDLFAVRFAPTRAGDWTYRTSSKQDASVDGLSGPEGRSEVIRVEPSRNPGFIEKSDTYYWKYTNGARFFPVGTTAYDWIGTQCAKGPALDFVVEFLKRHFNKVRFSYMSARLPDNAFGGRRRLSTSLEDGYHWYSDLSEVDSRVLNIEHWNTLDHIVRKLQTAGVHAELVLARKNSLGQLVQGNWLRGIGGRAGSPGLIGDKGIRYFVGRYAAFSRVWWCIANEYPEAGLTPADIARIGQRFRELDPYDHPLSVHWNEDWLFGGQTWPTHGVLQAHAMNLGIAGINANISALRERHGIPFSNDEYGYEDRAKTPNTADTVLRTHWALVLGGGYGSYGHSPTRLTGKYMWAGVDNYWKVQGTPASPPASVEEVVSGQEAAPWLARMRDRMNSGRVGYWRMKPANHVASGSASHIFCLAAAGTEYLASGEGGVIVLDLSAAEGKDLPVEEFDPKTGEVRELRSTRGASRYEHTAAPGRFVLLHAGAPAAAGADIKSSTAKSLTRMMAMVARARAPRRSRRDTGY
ncbi:MAG: DUF5060 domain-containing protein [Acidobacteriota bacterium]